MVYWPQLGEKDEVLKYCVKKKISHKGSHYFYPQMLRESVRSSTWWVNNLPVSNPRDKLSSTDRNEHSW